MAGEFLGQDYLNAAVDFGTSLGGGVLSTLSNTASTATDIASQGAGYLTSLTSDQQTKAEKELNDIKPTKINAQTTSPASKSSSSLNLNNLTNGTVNSFKSPDILNSLSGVGSSVLNKVTFGASDMVSPTVNNLASFGAQTSFNIASNSGLISPTVQNPSSRVSSIPGVINNSIDNTNTNVPILNPNLPFITDTSRIITPYMSIASESLDMASQPLTGINSMIFDKNGNIISYAGSGAQQLFGDVTNIIDTKEKESLDVEKSGIDVTMSSADRAADIAKSVLWDIPYMIGANTGNVIVNTGKVTKEQIEKIIDTAPNMTVAKINMQDGTTLMRWKPQENPGQSKSYPKEKESLLFDKGDSYITEGIPDNLKHQQKYKVIKGVSTNDNGSDTATYIPGVSNMLVKGLRYVEVPKGGESEFDKVDRIGNDNIFDPTKKNSIATQSDKLNNIASKYVYTQAGNSGYGYGNVKDKEKKKNIYRKKAAVAMPKIILVNALRRQINQITNRANNKHIPLSIKRKHIIKENPKKTEPQFIQRKPEVKFKVTTAMKGVSDISGNIESIISFNGSSHNTSLNRSSNKIVESPQFNFNLENILVKPKQTLKKGKNLINIKI
jgi:hypothetical protein